MQIARSIDFSQDKEQAKKIQEQLAQEIISQECPMSQIEYIAASDVCYGARGKEAFAAVVVISRETLEIVEQSTWTGIPEFNYQPGLLALREVPCLLKAFEKLKTVPDVVVIDGNGILHPRRFGLACHMGLSLDIPTIGCAKSLHFGKHKPLKKPGEESQISHLGEDLGIAMLPQPKEEPIYVSVGHKMDIESAKKIIQLLTKGTREPLPILHAHNICSTLYQKHKKIEDEEKNDQKSQILQEIKQLREQGLSYSKIANTLNNNKEFRDYVGRKFTPRKIRNWVENNG